MRLVTRLFLLFSILVACIPTESTFTSIPLEVTNETPTRVEFTLTPEITREPPVEHYYRKVSDTNYLKNCRRQYSFTSNQQIGFLDIYPGRTTANEVLARLGQPKRRAGPNEYQEWIYYDDNLSYDYHIFIEDNLVDNIIVEGNREILMPLEGILIKYGCPDLIIATELDPPPFAETTNYNAIFLIYHTAGMEVRFDGYPISFSQLASIVSFVKPLSLRDFLENQYQHGFLVDSFSSPVSLEEAVNDK